MPQRCALICRSFLYDDRSNHFVPREIAAVLECADRGRHKVNLLAASRWNQHPIESLLPKLRNPVTIDMDRDMLLMGGIWGQDERPEEHKNTAG